MIETAQRKVFGWLSEQFFVGASKLGRLHPLAKPEAHGVEVIENIPYQETGWQDHLLDIYRPKSITKPKPVILYIHGGGFRIGSKDSHWVMGLAFAREGYEVANINYRLSGTAKFPSAVEDSMNALMWVQENIGHYGGDATRIAICGESAGANLSVAVSLAATSKQLSNLVAARLYERKPKIKAVIPACGIFQVTSPERFHSRVPFYARPIIDGITENYLPVEFRRPGASALADPLVFLESGQKTQRKLPAFFTFVGGNDPIEEDSHRLYHALKKRGAHCNLVVYPRRGHAFHAFVFERSAQRAWQDQFTFLRDHLH